MDFLKKHYDKVALAAALLILIVAAIVLSYKVSSLSAEIQEAPRRPKPKGKGVQPIDMSVYTNALTALQQPAQWGEYSINPFQIRLPQIESPPTNIFIPPPPKGPPVVLLDVRRELFKLKFLSYTGEGENFQLNFINRVRTFIIAKVGMEVSDGFGKTGYIITKFERKTCQAVVPGVGQREVDCSELTVRHGEDDPIVLVLNKETEEREPVAVVQCTENSKQMQLHRQQNFDCGGKTYNVVDIGQKQMIIIDTQTKEKHTISLPEQSGTPRGAP
jgi:sorbitol-specific phosphotransferase system component IIA